MRGQCAFPLRRSRSWATTSSPMARRPTMGLPLLSKLPLEDVRTRPAWRRATIRRPATSKQSFMVRRERFASATSICPTAIRQIATNTPTSLRWMDRLMAHAHRLLALEEPLVLAGDYNVIPAPRDAKVPENWTADALFLPQTRARFREILNLGLTDATAPVTWRRTWNLHLLGLSGRCLAEEQRHSHRSPAVVAAGCGSSDGSARRQTCAGLGSAVGPRARHCDVQMKRPVALRQRAQRYLKPAPVTCRRA